MCNFETCFLSWQLTVLACVTLFEVIGSYLPCSYYVKGRERERRVVDAEYKLYEQFCNRAERPNCPVPSARRMRSREMARSQCWTASTLERLGTEVLVRSIYLFHSPHSNVRTFIPGTIDMCSRAKVPSFSTGHLHIPIQVNVSIFSSCFCPEIRTAFVSIIDYLLHMFSISPPLFLSPLQMQGDILWNLRDQMSRLGAHDDVDCRHQKISTCLPASLNVCLLQKMNET